MPRLSLTDFVDIVSAAGTVKATKVRQVKYRPPYQPAFDFYKNIRETIVVALEGSEGKDYVDGCLSGLTDPKKVKAYPPIVDGFKKWMGRKEPQWLSPPQGTYRRGEFEISINPEVGVSFNGKQYLLKLYFKADPLAKQRIDTILHLMSEVLSTQCIPGTIMAVLDVRRAKLIVPTIQKPNLSAMIDAEIDWISTFWNAI